MSSSASEVVSTTTGIRRSSSSALMRASTSRPSTRGRLRAGRMRPGRGASAYSPSWKRNASASSPLLTTWSSLAILASASASFVISTSPGSSSTRRISTGAAKSESVVTSGSIVVGDGEGPAHRRPLGDVGVDPDAAAMEFDDLLAQRQADARPGIELLGVEPLEDDEHPLGIGLLDADTVVRHPERPLTVVLGGGDLDAGRGVTAELEGVGDHVLEEGGQERRVALDGRQGPLADDLRPGVVDGRLQVRQGPVEGLVAVDRHENLGGPADPGEGQQVVDQRLHALGAVDGELDVLIGPLVELALVAALEELAEAGHLPERLLEVMGGDVGELLQVGVGAGQLLGLGR